MAPRQARALPPPSFPCPGEHEARKAATSSAHGRRRSSKPPPPHHPHVASRHPCCHAGAELYGRCRPAHAPSGTQTATRHPDCLRRARSAALRHQFREKVIRAGELPQAHPAAAPTQIRRRKGIGPAAAFPVSRTGFRTLALAAARQAKASGEDGG